MILSGAGYAPPGGTLGGIGALASPMYMEPTNWEIDLAVHNVNSAKTEAAAAKAAAAVYRVGLDMPDAVMSAFEEKVARLRNPNWNRPSSPPLPRSFRPLSFIIRAWNELQALANANAPKPVAANPVAAQSLAAGKSISFVC